MEIFREKKTRVYIILVNYNGWKDSIECLESILANNYSNFRTIVVDNGSTNRSFENLLSWAKGKKLIEEFSQSPVSIKPCPKPIDYQEIYYQNSFSQINEPFNDSSLIFIKSYKNEGFAKGNNIGIQFARKDPECKYFWFLNNDTVIERDTLSILVDDFQKISKTSKVGLLGSKLRLYHKPERLQAMGGFFNKYTTVNFQIGANEIDKGQFNKLTRVDYPVGASMLTSIEFIREIGNMCEDYFLYYEELDWVTKAKKSGWQAWNSYRSLVFHKHGQSTGQKEEKDFFVKNKYGVKGLILFYKRHFWFLIPVPYIRLFGSSLKKAVTGKRKDSYKILKYIFE